MNRIYTVIAATLITTGLALAQAPAASPAAPAPAAKTTKTKKAHKTEHKAHNGTKTTTKM
ncbi:MAG: hypothetical protein NTV70_11115 [Acidobacteria bacterium]|nr:hypothetical protein [Acidobacteriota bacterium]